MHKYALYSHCFTYHCGFWDFCLLFLFGAGGVGFFAVKVLWKKIDADAVIGDCRPNLLLFFMHYSATKIVKLVYSL